MREALIEEQPAYGLEGPCKSRVADVWCGEQGSLKDPLSAWNLGTSCQAGTL